MKAIEAALLSTVEYLVSITRDPEKGWYDIVIGIPASWTYKENDEISCKVLVENEAGRYIQISPKNDGVVVDDLITFIELILETNKKIAEKEKEFADRMAAMKASLETEVLQFYEELDKLKDNSFENMSNDFAKKISEEKKETRGRKSNKEKELINLTKTSTTGVTSSDTGIGEK